jgi:hypothetical protein
MKQNEEVKIASFCGEVATKMIVSFVQRFLRFYFLILFPAEVPGQI